MRILTAPYFLIALFFGAAAPALAASPGISAPVALLVDSDNHATLFARNADRPMPPASMAKMMTVFIAFDAIESGELALDKICRVGDATWEKWNNRGSTMFLKQGERVSVENLLNGIITLSGNDASIVLADCIAGSEAQFVQRMNKTAGRLGMKNSRFGTANGWPDEGRTMVTARDMARLGLATVQRFPELYRKFYGLPRFSWGGVTQPNRNPILGRIAGADGLKTGHTEEAGYAFAGSVEQDGRRLIFVLSQMESKAQRIEESVALAKWGFTNFRTQPLFAKQQEVHRAKVQLGDAADVGLVAGNSVNALIAKDSNATLQLLVRYNGPLKAPIAAGDPVATLEISSGTVTQHIPLLASENVGEAGFFDRVIAGLRHLLGWI